MHSTFEHRLRTGRKAVAFGFFVVLVLTFLTFVGSARAGIESGPAPQIWSDKADYAPGETVVLSGVNWAPGDTVHIRVNDDAGQTWTRDVDVTADASGAISDQFNLPDSFAASYTVTATSATGTATTSFTDGNVKFDVAPTGATAQFVETLYAASASCGGAVKSGFPKTLNGSNGDNVGVGNNESIRIDAAATSDQGLTFSAWSSTDSPASPFTVIAGTGGKSICIPGFQSGTNNYRATYQANAAPAIARNNASVTVNEGLTAANSGTWSDANAGDTVTLSASIGTVTKSGTNASGTWSWSFGTTDGPDQSQTVTITANDATTSTSTTFSLTVNNVVPTVTLSAANDLSVNEGSAQHTYSYTISDPGADTVTSVSTSCGANGVKVAGSDTNTNTAGSFKCTFADGPANSTVSAQATDSDGAAGNTATQTVVVANVAPTVVLSGATSANEGTTHTYTYTVSDPGADPSPVVSESCGTGGTKTDTAAANSFDCTFPDGPASSTVTVSANDGDPSNNIGSDSKTVVVANVAPTVVLSGATSANEGTTHTYTYTVSDPGADPSPVVSESCGSGGTKTDTAAANSFDCTFPDGPASSTVTVSADDGDASNNIGSDSKTVTVANVAPTVVLSGAASVNEGSTHTYSYTVTDPGQDSFTVSTGYPSCGTGGSVSGTPSTTASGGSFDCVFPDGPATTNVAIKVADSDGASDTDSESVVVVQVANVNPSVSAPADQAANEGASTSFTLGSFSDPGPDSPWTVDVDWGDGSAHGTASKSTTGSLGSMSHTYADGPATRTVTVTVTDKNGGVGSASFQVTVANVAPTVALSAANDLAVNEGPAEHTYSYSISDPGADTVSSVSTSCGANGVKVAGSDTNTNTAGSFKCTFADGPASSVVSAQATDSDGAAGNTATQTVVVANVAPTVVLSGAASVNEGSTHTYSYTVTDPGQDSFTVSTGYPSCGTGGSVSGTPSTTASGGSFDCVFPDGPATTNVAIKVADSDGASDTDSESVVVVQVANVAPTVVLSGDTSANEGSTHTYTYTVSDPGDDPNPTVTESCGSGGTKTDTAAANSFDCTFPDGPASSTVTVSADDGDASNNIGSDSKTVTVANVAPTVALSAANDLPSTRVRPSTRTATRSPTRALTRSAPSRPAAAPTASRWPAPTRTRTRPAPSSAPSRTGPPARPSRRRQPTPTGRPATRPPRPSWSQTSLRRSSSPALRASTRARPTLTPTRSPIRARTASRSRPVTRAAAPAAASPARLRRPLRAAASTASSRTGPPRPTSRSRSPTPTEPATRTPSRSWSSRSPTSPPPSSSRVTRARTRARPTRTRTRSRIRAMTRTRP